MHSINVSKRSCKIQEFSKLPGGIWEEIHLKNIGHYPSFS
jgi:hypothetical protein